VLFDQTHHMAEITVKGLDALRLCAQLTINIDAGALGDGPAHLALAIGQPALTECP
jgi:hypothetical protein